LLPDDELLFDEEELLLEEEALLLDEETLLEEAVLLLDEELLLGGMLLLEEVLVDELVSALERAEDEFLLAISKMEQLAKEKAITGIKNKNECLSLIIEEIISYFHSFSITKNIFI
jgi:hypothetical protein